MNASFLLWAAETPTTRIEWKNVHSNADLILPAIVFLAVAGFVVYMYRRDSSELSRFWAVTLTCLRVLTLLVLLLLWMYPTWRMEKHQTINSRVLVLIDTSMSMGLVDHDSGGSTGRMMRIQQVASALRQSDFIQRLRKTHDVVIGLFDEQLHADRVRMLAKAAREDESQGPSAGGSAALANEGATGEAARGQAEQSIDWDRLLVLGGKGTGLGQSLRQFISDHSDWPLAGVVLISDGGHNMGPGPQAALELSRELNVPIFTVGVGSDKLPPNVRVADFNPPRRAFPNDPFEVKASLQAFGMAGQIVTVRLSWRLAEGEVSAAATADPDPEPVEAVLGPDGQEVPVSFRLSTTSLGRRTLTLTVEAPSNDRDPRDNQAVRDIEIVDRKTRVLLFCDGPMREYQFLRNVLYRDKSVISDVYMQRAQTGISQEANEILDDFPRTPEEMFRYDCVVAFDPDWQKLDQQQIDLLYEWVRKHSGGLIVIPGAVNAGRPIAGWTQDEAMQKIRELYPVVFERRFSGSEEGMRGGSEPARIAFTPEGLEADFLWLTDSPISNREAWDAFPGVYSYFPVRGAKPIVGKVLARFGDEQSLVGGEQPVYIAMQNFGNGRVLYLGSGEMWRLRELDEKYFEQFYTNVIRYVSKGRLERDSPRGSLTFEADRHWVGDTVVVRGRWLTNAQLEPLDVPQVTLEIYQPDQSVHRIQLRPDPGEPGKYSGHFQAQQEGDYRLELLLPDSDQPIVRRLHVAMPDRERENPQRNDALLSEIARKSGSEKNPGQYFAGVDVLLENGGAKLLGLLADRTKTLTTIELNKLEEEKWLRILMYTLFGLLCLEWLIRRLLKLA